jgi:dUTP pyrophosphatase
MSNSYLLKIYIEDQSLKEAYQVHIFEHTDKIISQIKYGDSGFDLLAPDDITYTSDENTIKIDWKICCALFKTDSYEVEYPCAYYLYPRSSLYKTGLRLTNSVGIIDSGYRGHLGCFFDVFKNTTIPKFSRLVQICAPDLTPIYNIQIVDTLLELGITSRGSGGFGSTGI